MSAAAQMWFQFHKVQLKVSAEKMSKYAEKQFQFHKVQLKDLNLLIRRLVYNRFNSIRYN